MKHSEQLTKAGLSAVDVARAFQERSKRAAYGGEQDANAADICAALHSQTAALLEIARQIAITREEQQNGKPSRFDQR